MYLETALDLADDLRWREGFVKGWLRQMRVWLLEKENLRMVLWRLSTLVEWLMRVEFDSLIDINIKIALDKI